MHESRIEAFVRGVAFREPDLPVEKIAVVIRAALDRGVVFASQGSADRALVKLSALAVAFWREVGEVLAGNFELDFRDEAILDAVVKHLSGSVG